MKKVFNRKEKQNWFTNHISRIIFMVHSHFSLVLNRRITILKIHDYLNVFTQFFSSLIPPFDSRNYSSLYRPLPLFFMILATFPSLSQPFKSLCSLKRHFSFFQFIFSLYSQVRRNRSFHFVFCRSGVHPII